MISLTRYQVKLNIFIDNADINYIIDFRAHYTRKFMANRQQMQKYSFFRFTRRMIVTTQEKRNPLWRFL